MPTGPEHVQAALARIESASAALADWRSLEDGERVDYRKRLAGAAALIEGTTDRYFLKTRVCLPFARQCEEVATTLDALLAKPDDETAKEGLGAAVVALEKAARTLDERSMMQGMAIT